MQRLEGLIIVNIRFKVTLLCVEKKLAKHIQFGYIAK
jgi:hypothetical protein